MDNAHRFDVEHGALTSLTRALLPPTLPAIPGYELAGRYVAAAGDVGGDWYDAEVLPNHSLLVGVGDVAGHGIKQRHEWESSATPHALIARWRRRPRLLLNDLSAYANETEDLLATVAYARIDLETGKARWASAGHPSALHWHEQTVSRLPAPHGPPLGVAVVPNYREGTLTVAPGDLLVLYTDGVVERRHEAFDVGVDRLQQFIASCAGLPIEELAAAIVAEFCSTPADDCCLLLRRKSPAG